MSRKVDLVVLHTCECECRRGKAKAVARYFDHVNVSAHYIVDPGEVVAYAPEDRVCWHAPGVNLRSVGVELCGYAAQTWDDPLSESELELAVALVAGICDRWSIPRVWLENPRGASGITGHRQVTNAYCSGRGHQDPGVRFDGPGFAQAVAAHLAQRTP